MALTADYIQSCEGIALEIRALLEEMLGEIQSGGGDATIEDGSVTHAKLAANAVETDSIEESSRLRRLLIRRMQPRRRLLLRRSRP